ncbi:MAG: hypothetical protein WC055_16890 [Melioribacteraceae bacterium]
MINQAVYNLSLTRVEFKQLAAIKPWAGNHWDAPPNEHIEVIKTKIRQQLETAQTVCSYCGLKLGGTSNGEIEHIAAKAYYRNPEFTFTLKNLTLSCHLCNGFYKKGTTQTIGEKKQTYSKCRFLIVHPYLDDPSIHYEWTDNHVELLIQVKDNSPKGLFSVNLFGLDTPTMNELRAQQVRFEEMKAAMPLSNDDQILLNETMTYI